MGPPRSLVVVVVVVVVVPRFFSVVPRAGSHSVRTLGFVRTLAVGLFSVGSPQLRLGWVRSFSVLCAVHRHPHRSFDVLASYMIRVEKKSRQYMALPVSGPLTLKDIADQFSGAMEPAGYTLVSRGFPDTATNPGPYNLNAYRNADNDVVAGTSNMPGTSYVKFSYFRGRIKPEYVYRFTTARIPTYSFVSGSQEYIESYDEFDEPVMATRDTYTTVPEHDIAGTFIDDPDAANADPAAVLPVETDPVGDEHAGTVNASSKVWRRSN
jgi:hypothetical protein